LYEAAVNLLLEEGHAYHCFCPQELLDQVKDAQLAAGEMPVYDRRCTCLSAEEVQARLAAGEKAAVRFRVPEGSVTFDDLIHGPITFSSDVIGDFIIKRTDGGYAYNFAVVVDDLGMQITDVIRGEDHITNTARQMMIFAALGKQAPRYGHHSLILAPDGSKLSKRHGATSIGDFKGLGYLPEAIVNYLTLLSWHPADEREKFSMAELIEEFDITRVSKSPAIFDIQKLNWLNGLYIRELTVESLLDCIEPYLTKSGIELRPVQREAVATAIQPKLEVLADAPTHAAIFVEEGDPSSCDCSEKLLWPGVGSLVSLASEAFAGLSGEYVTVEEARGVLHGLVEVAKQEGLKGKSIFQPLRVALSAQDEGPDLFYLVAGLGKSKILTRLKAAGAFVAERGE
jgi:nondiscriminating glutamyl-tRNA synthetase